MLSRTVAILILILVSPLFVGISLLILVEDGFPVFFKQKPCQIQCESKCGL